MADNEMAIPASDIPESDVPAVVYDAPEINRPFETLELLAAILLGLAAIATSFASFESALYGGDGSVAFSRANKIATEAAAERSNAIVQMTRDSQVEMDAWRLTREADDSGNPADEARNYEIATYLYTKVMSEPGYKAMGLPPEARAAAMADEAEDDAAALVDENGDELDSASVADAAAEAAADKQNAMQEKVLETAMDHELAGDTVYSAAMLAKSKGLFDESEKTFQEGQKLDGIGDQFQLVALVFAISLFFGGIVQVFRNDRMRWGILVAGGVLLVVGMGYMLTLPWSFS